MDKRRARFVCAILSGLSLMNGQAAWGKATDTHAVAVLFERFETVFSSTPNLLSEPPHNNRDGFVWQPFDYLRAGLETVQKQAPMNLLADSDAILLGSKDYHFPIGLGPVRSTRCYIAVLKKQSTFQLSRYFTRSPIAFVDDEPVWTWSAKLGEFGEEDPRSSALFATQLMHSYIVVSNDLEELLGLSARLASVGDDSSVLAGIRELNDASQHEFWGYRKFRHDQFQVNGRISTGVRITPDAEALITYVDLKKQTGVLRLLSYKADDATAVNINANGNVPPLKPIEPKIWETNFPLAEVGPFHESAFWVQWLFGLGVVV